MEGILLLAMIFIGLIQLGMIIKFFQMATDISRIQKSISQFTKYYYDLQDFKHSKDKVDNIAQIPQFKKFEYDPAIFSKPIDEKLTLAEYEIIYEKDNNKFMDIANYFFKIEREFYNTNIMPIFEKNKP